MGIATYYFDNGLFLFGDEFIKTFFSSWYVISNFKELMVVIQEIRINAYFIYTRFDYTPKLS